MDWSGELTAEDRLREKVGEAIECLERIDDGIDGAIEDRVHPEAREMFREAMRLVRQSWGTLEAAIERPDW